MNRIANVPSPVPGLIQDDATVSYCNADKLPETCDIAMDNRTVCRCTHLIELELGEIYEFLLVNRDRMNRFNCSFISIVHCMNLIDLFSFSRTL